MRLLPRSLSGQLIVLLLIALVVAQGMSFTISWMQHRSVLRDVARENILVRTASVVRLLEATPPQYHEQLVRTSSTRGVRYWLSAESAVEQNAQTLGNPLADELAEILGPQAEKVLVALQGGGPRWHKYWRERRKRLKGEETHEGHKHKGDDEHDEDHDHLGKPSGFDWLTVSVKPTSGPWLNAVARGPHLHLGRILPPLWSMLLTGIAISLVVILVIRRITRPLQQLASAADSFGRGEDGEPVPEEGPEQVRRTIAAFNRMRARLSRFVQDRTRMLAAISHDLRTPITSLRLRAEMIEDEEERSKFIETLDEMQRMTDATLAFAREEAAKEDTRSVDLAALVQSTCDDLADMGRDVQCEESDKIIIKCRPVALKRALRNLIENAVSYGVRANVRIADTPEAVSVVIEDEGPGIAPERFDEVFKPFVRLEESRSRETGGAGLGMAIARSIVRGHGGDITLENREEGGLRVRVTLPRIPL